MAFSGDQTGNTPLWWNAGFNTLPGHTAVLPAQVNKVHTKYDGGFWEMPFYKEGGHCWSIRGEGKRWEVDNWLAGGGQEHLTQHSVYVRTKPGAWTEAPVPGAKARRGSSAEPAPAT